MSTRKRIRFKFVVLVILLISVCILSYCVGPTGWGTDLIRNRLRLPRILAGFLTGAALAVAGAWFQGLFRNELAEPYILGTSSGAAVGCVLGSILGWSIIGFKTFLLSIGLSWLTVIVVERISRVDGVSVPETLILAGVIVGAGMTSLLMLLMTLFPQETFSALFFLMGSLQTASYDRLLWPAIITILLCPFLYRQSLFLDSLSFGLRFSEDMGFNPARRQKLIFFLSCSLVAVAVSMAGLIGFIGLVVPHILRLIFGPRHSVLFAASLLGGPFLLISCDLLARICFSPIEVPVGIITAMLGAPFFLFILRRKLRQGFTGFQR